MREHIYRERFRNDLDYIAHEVRTHNVNIQGKISGLINEVNNAPDHHARVEELLDQFWRKSPETWPPVLEQLESTKKQIQEHHRKSKKAENRDIFDEIAEEKQNH